MSNLFSVNWWVSTLVSTLITCIFVVILKKLTTAVNIPVVSNVMAEV